MRRLSPRLFLLVFLTVLQAAHGFFSGAALCREETGKVSLEWSRNGQCENPGALEIECLEVESHASEHCGPCFDVPLPAETSLKSVVASPGLFPAELLMGFEFTLVETSNALPAPASAPGSLATDLLGSVRLLI